MSAAKRDARARLGPIHGLPEREGDETLGALCARAFGRSAPLLLDVGVGDGRATVAWAAERPDCDVLGVDLHRPSVATTLSAIDEVALVNVRVVEADVRLLLDWAAPGELQAVRVLFPDPWPKRRQSHRRLIDGVLVARVAHAQPPGATLQVATDNADYAARVGEVLGTDGCFDVVVLDDAGGPRRPVTPYEQRARDAGRPVVEIIATRRR